MRGDRARCGLPPQVGDDYTSLFHVWRRSWYISARAKVSPWEQNSTKCELSFLKCCSPQEITTYSWWPRSCGLPPQVNDDYTSLFYVRRWSWYISARAKVSPWEQNSTKCEGSFLKKCCWPPEITTYAWWPSSLRPTSSGGRRLHELVPCLETVVIYFSAS